MEEQSINNILTTLVGMNKSPYAGTAKRSAVKKRRAKNKLARKQRKINNK